MKIIRNKIIPFRGFHAINLFGVLFVRGIRPISKVTYTHESIHTAQWKELWYIGFLFWYVTEWLIRLPKGNAYRNISFEREAYSNDKNQHYLESRKSFAFIKHLKQ